MTIAIEIGDCRPRAAEANVGELSHLEGPIAVAQERVNPSLRWIAACSQNIKFAVAIEISGNDLPQVEVRDRWSRGGKCAITKASEEREGVPINDVGIAIAVEVARIESR